MVTTLNSKASSLGSIIAQQRESILSSWLRDMLGSTRRSDLMKESEFQAQCNQFLTLLVQATAQGIDLQGAAYEPMRAMLTEISRTRAMQGFTARETATFIFSVKQPLFTAILEAVGNDTRALADEMWQATEL